MTLYVTELTNIQRLKAFGVPVSLIPTSSLASYALTSASTNQKPQVGTQFIRVSADAGMLLSVYSTSSAPTLGSSNANRIPANVTPELFAVSTAYFICAQST